MITSFGAVKRRAVNDPEFFPLVRVYPYTHVIQHNDGDTTDVDISVETDAGFSTLSVIQFEKRVRWYGVNSPEKDTPEGVVAREAIRTRFPVGSMCELHCLKTKAGTEKREKFGRYLGIFIFEGENMNAWLLNNGYATEYYGEKR